MKLQSSVTTGIASDTITSTTPAVTAKAILTGKTDGGQYLDVPVTGEGHIEISISDPLLPFGAVHAESLTPVMQASAIYGLGRDQLLTQIGSGTATHSGNLFTVATGTTANSLASIVSRQRLKYRPGQGMLARFTALFSAPAASSALLAGLGTGEGGFYFGYNGTSSSTNYSTQVAANGSFVVDFGDFTGTIKGFWASANGAAMVTEFI